MRSTELEESSECAGWRSPRTHALQPLRLEAVFFFARCCLGKVPDGAPFSQLYKGIGSITRTDQLMQFSGWKLQPFCAFLERFRICREMSFTSWANDIVKIDVLSPAKNKLSPAFVFLLSRNFRLQICTDACAETLDVHCHVPA